MKKLVVIVGVILFLWILASIKTFGTTRMVTNLTNNNPGSLRQEIINANNGDTIIFMTGLIGSIQLTSPLILNKNLSINGPGANVLSLKGRSAPTESRIFSVTAGNVQISGLRISNGFSSGAGGGVLVDGGNLTLNNCLLNGNDAESGGGALVFTGSTLTITNSTITGNSSAAEGGGISNRGGTLMLINSTINGNKSPNGGGVSADFGGTTTILNSTITGNGVFNPQTGDIGGLRIGNGATVNLKNTIVADNIGSPAAPTDIGGAVNSQGNNLIENITGATINGNTTGNITGQDPQLGALAGNGGTTLTQALMAGSPAIDGGNDTGAPVTDQRGVVRPQGAVSDIGAYEFGVNPPAFGKIVFVSNLNGNNEIYSMNADFTSQTRLTNNSADDSAPKWSPDGTKIVFQSNRDGNDEIYLMNSDGSGQTRLTFASPRDNFPDWSPDGSRIVFVKDISFTSEIWVMDTAGANQMQLTGSSLFGETQPSWSPDGSRIAFSASPINGGVHELYIMNADGTNRNRLTTNSNTDSYPVWSPDGNSIAYINEFNGRHAYLMNLFDLSVRIASDVNGPNESAPAWSPDGTKLAQYNTAGNIYFTSVGGSNALSTALAPEGIFISPQLDWFGSNTPAGANVTAISGTVSATFSSISTSGTTTAVPIDPTTAGTVPSGYSLGAGYPAYEITTTATYTAPITVCLQVPSTTPLAVFNTLRILHYVNGNPTDSTILPPNSPAPDFAAKTICANVTSLSPFVVAQNLAPTAANVTVGGRVLTSNGSSIIRAQVSITNQNGETRWALTNSFGFYHFDEIRAGETYVINVRHKVYQFSSQVITVSEDIRNADFIAESK